MSRTLARLEILNEIMSFPQIRGKDWTENRHPIAGDLIAMNCAPPSKWYLSWFIEEDAGQYLLESIEDGQECWWGNVGLSVFNRERVANRPDWRWSDRQHQLNDRWKRVCYKDHDAYSVRPNQIQFHDDGSATLSLREMFSTDLEFRPRKTYPDWRKITKKIMGDFYLEGEAAYQAHIEKRAAERKSQ